MRRFTFDTQINNTNIWGLYSFMFTKNAMIGEDGQLERKYIYDAKQIEHYGEPWSFDRN